MKLEERGNQRRAASFSSISPPSFLLFYYSSASPHPSFSLLMEDKMGHRGEDGAHTLTDISSDSPRTHLTTFYPLYFLVTAATVMSSILYQPLYNITSSSWFLFIIKSQTKETVKKKKKISGSLATLTFNNMLTNICFVLKSLSKNIAVLAYLLPVFGQLGQRASHFSNNYILLFFIPM